MTPSALSQAINRRKTILPGLNEQEDDCGFKFQRKQAYPLDQKKNSKASEEHEKKNTMSRRRKSLIGNAISQSGNQRRSLISTTLSLTIPPVPSSEWHKHLLPDLPGPSKLRQLLIWSVQSWIKNNSHKSKKIIEAAKYFTEGLTSQQFNTSWYQRSAESTNSPNASLEKNPENVELEDTIFILREYQNKLKNEIDSWKKIQSSQMIPSSDLNSNTEWRNRLAEQKENFGKEMSDRVLEINNWVKEVPLALQGMKWNLQMLSTFEERSKSYCEDVFKQLNEQINIQDPEKRKIEPLLVLKALSKK